MAKNRKNDLAFWHSALLVAMALTAVLVVGSTRLQADEQTGKKEPSAAELDKKLLAAWVYSGTPKKEETPPASGGRLKFFAGKHWSVTDIDPDTGSVSYHHGGTSTLDGDLYTETVTFATEETARLIGNTFKFKINGDKYTQIGVGDENSLHEVWRRAK